MLRQKKREMPILPAWQCFLGIANHALGIVKSYAAEFEIGIGI